LFFNQKGRRQKDDKLCCVLLWEFNIIPSPTFVTIRPPKLDILEDILNDLLLVNLDEPLLCNCIKQPLNPMCLVKIHGEEMPDHDVESIGAESGVTDMDKIDEIQQLTQLLGVEPATGDAKYMNDSSSD
jgi:hypothetical protein